MQGQGQSLRDETPSHVTERAAHVHRVLEVVRIGRTDECDRHFVDHGVERVLHQLEQDRVAEIARLHVNPPP